jgi:hypothetical protein
MAACFTGETEMFFTQSDVYGGVTKNYNINGNQFSIRLNGWDAQGTTAYLTVNGQSYTELESQPFSINGVYFIVDSVDVATTGGNVTASVLMCADRSCKDSDGGLNANVKGTTSGYLDNLGGTWQSASDYCDPSNPNAVVEYWCYGAVMLQSWEDCDRGCSNGACVQTTQTCTDSDGGINYTVQGTTTGLNPSSNQTVTVSDVCTLGGSLTGTCSSGNCLLAEYYCNGNYINGTTYSCPNGCSIGACVTTSPRVCTDSDNGTNYNIKGTTTGYGTDGNLKTVTDYCMNINAGGPGPYVNEFICQPNGDVNDIAYNCPNGCSEGACINQTTQTCTDSDGGKDYYVKGTTTGIIRCTDQAQCMTPQTVSDLCGSDGFTLTEFYCDNDGFQVVDLTSGTYSYKCPNGCSDGACIANSVVCKPGQKIGDLNGDGIVSTTDWVAAGNIVSGIMPKPENICCVDATMDGQITSADYDKIGRIAAALEASPGYCASLACTDSDGGNNVYLKGYVTLNSINYPDTCYTYATSTSTLNTNSCTGSNCYISEYYCQNNQVAYNNQACSNGCSNGACVGVEAAKEQVKCVFKNSNYQQSCYSDDGRFSCSGTGTCIADVYGNNGEKLTWKSSCGGYAYTVIDGQNEYAEFDCGICGNGICEAGEADYCPPCVYSNPPCMAPCTAGTCNQDCSARCPKSIDIYFSKSDYYPGEQLEGKIVVYDANGNLMPNQPFNIYNERQQQTSTYYTDANGVYKTTATVPYDSSYNGMWTFVASVSQEGCPYVYDKATIYLHISSSCGDGKCEGDEKEIVCSTSCTACPTNPVSPTYSSSGGGFSATGAMTSTSSASTTQISIPEAYPTCGGCVTTCNAKCAADCTPNCGNGVCDSVTCEALGCPLPENEKNCPQDCATQRYCGDKSSDATCICQPGYVKEKFEAACEQNAPAATSSGGAGGAASATGYVTGSSSGANTAVNPVAGSPVCPDVCVPMWKKVQIQCIRAPCYPVCEYTQCGSGCGPDGVTMFKTEEDCKASIYKCTESDGGKNYYVKGYVSDQYTQNLPEGKLYDSCSVKNSQNNYDFTTSCKGDNCFITEYFCYGSNNHDTSIIACPNGCSDGACISDTSIVKEQVKCVFDGSGEVQKCYSTDGRFGCSGTDACIADVYGKGGEKLTWKSSCGGYAYTTIDGENEYANFQCVSSTCVYYRCVPEYKSLYLTTDKYSYNLGEVVTIKSNEFSESGSEPASIKAVVYGPYNDVLESVMLSKLCAESTCACLRGAYCKCPPSKKSCAYSGQFSGTKTIGSYTVNAADGNSGFSAIGGTSFVVFDYSLLEKYLILKDIDGFVYRDSKASPGGPEGMMGYIAMYEKSGREYAAIVAEFTSREMLERYLREIIGGQKYSEKKVGSYYVYYVETGGQKVHFWTYNNFLAIVGEQTYTYATAQKNLDIAPQLEKTKEAEAPSSAASSGIFTGMMTSGTSETTNEVKKYCGSDSPYTQCVCGSDETKEEFMPPCNEGSACAQIMHYRCRQSEPTELLKAYLDKYPSDIRTSGTQCEQKSGYCISSGDSCKEGYEDTSFTCSTTSEKCCVKTVSKDDFIDIVMKLEGVRVKMDKMERQSNALSAYYSSVNETERANKFSGVADMFAQAKNMIDDITSKIRANLDNTESIRDEIKKDVLALKDYIDTILEKMVS